jgi:hypothetical protein
MHALPSHPKHPLAAAVLALLAAFAIMAAAAPDLGTVDVSLGGGTSSQAARVEQAVPPRPHAGASATPSWVTNPMSPPTDILAGRR